MSQHAAPVLPVHVSLHHLDIALGLTVQERLALEEGRVDDAVQIAEQRENSIAFAWFVMDGCDSNIYSDRLHTLYTAQERTRGVAKQLYEDMRTSLIVSRKEGKRLAGYRQAVSHALH